MNLIYDAKRMRQNKHLGSYEKLWKIYKDLQNLPLMEYNTKNKQENDEKKSSAKKFWAETYNNDDEKWDSTMDSNTLMHTKQQEQDR